MNLSNVHMFSNLVKTNKEIVIGQGLVSSYNIIIENATEQKNYYTIIVMDDMNNEYNIYFSDSEISEWSIQSKFEECDEIVDNIEFDVYGNFNNLGYYQISNGDCDNNEYLHVMYKRFKIKDIMISHVNSLPINEVRIDMTKLIEINYDAWIENYDINQMYILMADNNKLLPFYIKHVKERYVQSGGNDIIEACVIYENIKYDVEMELFYVTDDEYDIQASFKIINECLDDVYVEYFEYCKLLMVC
jgi:hypothetical protein